MKASKKCFGGFTVEKTLLGEKGDFSLFYTLMTSNSKDYVKDVFVKFKGKTIVYDYIQTVGFFSFMEIFLKKGLVSGHESHYFRVCEETKNNKRFQSLKCKFSKNEYYLDIPTAKFMLNIYNQTKIGRSFSTVLKNKIVLSYDGIVESEANVIKVNSNKDIDNLINSYLNNENEKLDNSFYFSDKISQLLDTIKENE